MNLEITINMEITMNRDMQIAIRAFNIGADHGQNAIGSLNEKQRDAILSWLIASVPGDEPVEIDWPEYHYEAMGCGLEDQGITDRYEAMRYGFDCAMERVAERLPEKIYISPQPVQSAEIKRVEAQRDASNRKIEELTDALVAARRKAIEECAQVCDVWSERFGYGHLGQEIRAILNKSEGGTK